MVPLFESLHTDVKLEVTVTDWMSFPWIQHLGVVAMVGRFCVNAVCCHCQPV